MKFAVDYDVLIIGGGNAAMCAAITAAENGARVILFEAAPKFYRGGNTRHTRNLRCAHETAIDMLSDVYLEKEFYDDLIAVTGSDTDTDLAKFTVSQSKELWDFLKNHGVLFQPALAATVNLDRTNAFFLGGGRALLNSLYRYAENLDIQIEYDAQVVELSIEDGHFVSAHIHQEETNYEVRAQTLIAAAGGFQANIEWLKEVWGPQAENFLIRGTRFNRGSVLKILLDKGVQQIGEANQCHAVAIDARAPKFDGGIATRVDGVSFGIVVNQDGQRFYDEGEDFWGKRYAIWGKLIAQQPDQIAYAILDNRAIGQFIPPMYPPVVANDLCELATQLKIDPSTLVKTISDFNDSVVPGTVDRTILDDCRTEGLEPPKTHWAVPITESPFYAYPLRPGITFTYLGVRVNNEARMIMHNGSPSHNMFAAGEIMAGNILSRGYLAGIGMTIGGVFGRTAGLTAAHALR